MAAKPGKTRTASTSGDSRVPLMDLTSLAPEDQERGKGQTRVLSILPS